MALNDYPHIAERIKKLWGTRECRSFLLELISDSRDGKRQGLPEDVAREILGLIDRHDDAFPVLDDSHDFVKTTYRAAPRPPPRENQNEGVVLKFLVKIAAWGIVLALIWQAYRRLG